MGRDRQRRCRARGCEPGNVVVVVDANPMELKDELRAALRDPHDAGLKRLVALHRPIDPASTTRVRTAWHALLEDRTLAPDAVAALHRSGALEAAIDPQPRLLVQDLVSALGRWRHEEARPLLERLWAPSGFGPAVLRAGHALLAFGDRAALDALTARLDETSSGALTIALQAVFTTDPARAWDHLAPRWASPSSAGAVLLDATLTVLMRDLGDDGKQHWGPARRWFRADPRWRELCEAWRSLPPPAQRRAWGAVEAQRIVEAAGWLRGRPAS